MPDGRCEYEYEGGTVEEDGAATCWRPVWGDRDRCLRRASEAEELLAFALTWRIR